MKHTLLTLIISIIFFTSVAQEIVTDLNGFRLGQFREVAKNELKTIIKQDKYEDGFEYEIFLIEPDTSVYMIFEYANYDLSTIWSIQLTGSKSEYDCMFKGLKLGMTSKEVEKSIGKPSSIEDIGEYGKKWVYDKTNYSLEISPNGVLSSIKIIDMSNDFFPTPDISKIPTYEQYKKILKSGDRKYISELLAPDIEVYKNDSTFFYNSSISNEIKNDNSGIFKLVNEMVNIIEKINDKDTLQYEENIRITEFKGILHVAKFNLNGKKSEIVFKYLFGKYFIWEIKLN